MIPHHIFQTVEQIHDDMLRTKVDDTTRFTTTFWVRMYYTSRRCERSVTYDIIQELRRNRQNPNLDPLSRERYQDIMTSLPQRLARMAF